MKKKPVLLPNEIRHDDGGLGPVGPFMKGVMVATFILGALYMPICWVIVWLSRRTS